MIEAITFDFWNTLFVAVWADEARRRQIKQALEKAGNWDITGPRIQQAIDGAWREWDRVWVQEYRTFGANHWVGLILADLGVDIAQSDREGLVRSMMVCGMDARPPLVDGLDVLLPRLAQRYRLGLICDTGLSPGWMLRQWMDQHGILDCFSHLTFSDELGVSKPHPDAFLTTLAALEVAPEAAVHIGDYPRTDIAGAQGAGMQAIRFTGVHDWEDGKVRADAEIGAFSQLEPLLKRWEG